MASKLVSFARAFAASLVLIAGLTPSFVRGQTPTVQLPEFVTTATRTSAEPQTLGSALDVITGAELARRQITALSAALGGVAGAPLFSSGGSGATTSLFLRGANSNQTLFLVDGLRLNDPNTDYAVFLGGACVSGCDSLEIAHGPQSTLYGGEAVGGVVSLRAQRGRGAVSGRIAAEAGSFGTVQGAVATQGERGPQAFNFSAQGGRTENDRPNNGFSSASTTLRLDRTITPNLAVGGTLRWFHGVYGDPGDHYTNDPDNESREDNVLATAFADVKLAPAWTARAILGGQDRRFVSENPRPNGTVQITLVKNRRGVLDAQTTFAGIERHRLTGGLTAEANHTRNTGFGEINEKQMLFAAFVQDEFSPRDDVFLTAGVRNDDFDTFGRATTGRATAAWLVVPRSLKLRASYGTAFRSPSFLDLYGRSAFYNGNPQLRPERARSWDAGADWYLPQQRGVLGMTWFDARLTNLIASTPDFRSVENIQRARTRGVEVSGQLALPGLATRASYTFLEADNLTAGERLLRRPRHRATLDAWHDFGGGLSLGAGATWVAQREDFHARTFARVDGEDYTVARIYGAFAINNRLALRARIENLFDEKYEEVNGYPALGLGAFASVEWKW
ncbi:MAG: TonB-dependent receptor [Opitutaceae bacterium]|nr:TonB-dependent receptor [Opitutaceae bacterium]